MSLNADQILDYFKDELGIDVTGIEPDSLVFSTGIIDSFALVSLMTFIETTANIRIAPTDVNLANFDSVARMVAYANAPA